MGLSTKNKRISLHLFHTLKSSSLAIFGCLHLHTDKVTPKLATLRLFFFYKTDCLAARSAVFHQGHVIAVGVERQTIAKRKHCNDFP
jgi:hypothetical protein